MAKYKQKDEAEAANQIRFNLAGLIIFSLGLMVGTSLITTRFFNGYQKVYTLTGHDAPAPDALDKNILTSRGPWGELRMQNINLERPVEYISKDLINPEPPRWFFNGMNAAQVRALLVAHGLTGEQADKALAPERITAAGNGIWFAPGDDFVLSLSAEVRQKLYADLAGRGVNSYIDYPFVFQKDSIESLYADPDLAPEDTALLRKLVYRGGDATRLSDYQTLLGLIPTAPRKIAMARALSRQPAVLAGLRIRPDTDIDKIASYWGNVDNVRLTDTRPMLEALKGLPNGGSASLLYFLPPFARDRLYTFPLPPQPGDPHMDCHWSTFNFCNVQPDNRYNNPAFVAENLAKNYYQINSPSLYGDIVLLATDQQIQHSAVYLADDLVFTKYGDNYRQPWMIVRISDMQAMFPTLKTFFYRKKTD